MDPLLPDTAASINVRWMIRRDMVDVQAIEEISFQYAWREDDFYRALQARNCIGLVAERAGKVVGYTVYELHKRHLHVLNLAAWPRRHGTGAALVAKLVSKLSPQRRSAIAADVRETNLPAQLFFKAQGFWATAILPHYYDDAPGEAAYRFRYHLGQKPTPATLPTNRISHLLPE